MESFKRFARATYDSGCVLALGVGCLALYSQQHFPKIWGPVSVGITVAGALGLARYITMDHDDTDVNVVYLEFRRKLEHLLPKIEEDFSLWEEIQESCNRSMSMRERLEEWRRDPSLIEDRIALLKRLLQKTQKASSYGASGRTLETLSDMRSGQRPYSASPREEDIAVVHNVEVEDQTDSGNVQQEEQQRQEDDEEKEEREKCFFEMPNDIPEAVQNLRHENVIKGLNEGMLEMALEEVLRDVSEEVLNEQFDKKRLQDERIEEMLGLEAVEAVAEKETVKTIPAMDVVEGFLQQMVANKSLMQEIVKNVLEKTNKDVLEEIVVKEGKLLEAVKNMMVTKLVKEIIEGKVSKMVTVEEVPEEKLQFKYETEKALGEIFRNLLPSEPEREEEEKQKLPVKPQGNLEIEDEQIQKQEVENPEIISVEVLQKNKEEEIDIENVIEAEKYFAEML